MIGFPGSPRLLKGAILSAPTVIPFQYNPETLSRTVTVNASSGATSTAEVLRIKGPPSETIQVEIQLDATDQLEQAAAPATTVGIGPQLAALEVLLYPLSLRMIANEALALVGITEVIAPEAPLCIFVWGAWRVLPVRITEMSIVEEAFDPNLNPIRAKVNLSLKVLNYQDLGLDSVGGALFMTHQIIKEAMALQATLAGAGTVVSSLAGGAGAFAAGANALGSTIASGAGAVGSAVVSGAASAGAAVVSDASAAASDASSPF